MTFTVTNGEGKSPLERKHGVSFKTTIIDNTHVIAEFTRHLNNIVEAFSRPGHINGMILHSTNNLTSLHIPMHLEGNFLVCAIYKRFCYFEGTAKEFGGSLFWLGKFLLDMADPAGAIGRLGYGVTKGGDAHRATTNSQFTYMNGKENPKQRLITAVNFM